LNKRKKDKQKILNSKYNSGERNIRSDELIGKRGPLTEESIRPHELMEKMKEYVDCDRNFLLERQHRFVKVDCPACSSKKHVFHFEKLGIRYRLCQNCETVFVSPRPSLKLLHEFYVESRNYYFWNKYIFPKSEETRREKIFKPRVERTVAFADHFLSRYESIMEVGAGFGTFCEGLVKSKRFKKVLALEPTPDLAETCRKRSLETLEMPVEDLPEDVKVDIITSFEVIEHLFSVEEFFHNCAKHLKAPGLLILSCPNFQGFDFQILGIKYEGVDHEHLNYFNPNSLKLLIERCGFQVLELLTPGQLDADIVHNRALKGIISLENQPFLKTVLIDRWAEIGNKFQKFLIDNLMSGHMWAVAKKRI